MPQPYLLQVYSQPRKISEELWIQWYLEEHIRDMVYFDIVKTAGFYQSSSPVYSSEEPFEDGNEARTFVAMFETDHEKVLSNPRFREKVRQTTDLWGGRRGREVGELADIESKLIEVLGSTLSAERATPHFIQLKFSTGKINNEAVKQIVEFVSVFKGYRRTLHYQAQEQLRDAKAFVTFIHEFETLDPSCLPALNEGLKKAEPTKERTYQLRSYELLDSEGFGGVCSIPARL